MKSKKLLISVSGPLVGKLEEEKRRGVTASGLIRHLLNRHFGLEANKERKTRIVSKPSWPPCAPKARRPAA